MAVNSLGNDANQLHSLRRDNSINLPAADFIQNAAAIPRDQTDASRNEEVASNIKRAEESRAMERAAQLSQVGNVLNIAI